MCLLIIVFINAINVTGIFIARRCRSSSEQLSLYFHLTEIFDTASNSQKYCTFVVFFLSEFFSFFFSYFLNAVSQPRQIEVSRWRFSSEYKRKKFPLVPRRGLLAKSRRIRDIVCKAVDVYRKLSSKLKFEKLHIAAREAARSQRKRKDTRNVWWKKKSRCNEVCRIEIKNKKFLPRAIKIYIDKNLTSVRPYHFHLYEKLLFIFDSV